MATFFKIVSISWLLLLAAINLKLNPFSQAHAQEGSCGAAPDCVSPVCCTDTWSWACGVSTDVSSTSGSSGTGSTSGTSGSSGSS